MAFYHGKDGKIRIGGATLKINEWSGDVKAQKHDITSSESGGYGTYQGGVFDVDPLTIQFQFEVGTAPLTALSPGTVVASVILYTGGTSGPSLTVSLYVETFRITNRTREITTCVVTGCASGTFATASL